MKFLLIAIIGTTLVANIIASDPDGGLVRVTREDDDDVEPDERDIEELKAAMARKPKINRPAYSSLNKKKNKTTTAAPSTEAPATQAPILLTETEPQPQANTANRATLSYSTYQARALQQPQVLPSRVEFSERHAKAASRFSGGTKGGSEKSAKGLLKGNAPAAYSPIAKGKSMYRPRLQVPVVEAPLPSSDLLVPSAPENRYSQVNSIQEKTYSVVAPISYPVPDNRVTLQEQVPSVVAPVRPIARGSRPRSGAKSKVVSNDYPLRADLSPAYQAKALARAEVSEEPFDECPYGMRLSVCRKARAAAQFARS